VLGAAASGLGLYLYTVDARGGRFTQLTTSMGSIQGMSWR
jgi:hypothetical protein